MLPKLVSVESTWEAAGKSTMCKLLVDKFKPSISFKFPDGEFRKLILNGLDPKAHMLVQHAEFAQSLTRQILPALELNQWVFLDRWIDSSLAYQGYGSGLDLTEIRRSIKLSTNNILPDITILLDLDPEIAQARLALRQEQPRVAEKAGLEFAHKVRLGYLELAKQDPTRIKIIDASGSQEQVFVRIQNIL